MRVTIRVVVSGETHGSNMKCTGVKLVGPDRNAEPSPFTTSLFSISCCSSLHDMGLSFVQINLKLKKSWPPVPGIHSIIHKNQNCSKKIMLKKK